MVSMPIAHIRSSGGDKLPRALSPSRAADFVKCPAQYYLGAVRRLREPAKDYLLVGNLAHFAYEETFNLPAADRTPDNALPFVDKELQRLRDAGSDLHLIGTDEGAAAIAATTRQMVINWFSVERPHNFEPIGREVTVKADIGEGCTVFGIIDRLDRVEFADKGAAWMVSDYKTGKVPSASSRYLDERFFQLRTYALALDDALGVEVSKLRLVYTARGRREDVRTRPCDKKVTERTRSKLLNIWSGIQTCHDDEVWPCKVQRLCDWCSFQPECPAFNDAFADGDAARIAQSFTERAETLKADAAPLERATQVTITPASASAAASPKQSDDVGVAGLDASYTGTSANW